jgi:acyl-CoA oxidase
LSTWYAFDAIQESRKACGGHGYSGYSHLPTLRDYHDPFQTFEGDNNILLQQLERWLLNPSRESPLQSAAILKHLDQPDLKSSWNGTDPAGLDLEAALEFRACHLLREAQLVLQETMSSYTGSSKKEYQDFAWNSWNKVQPGAPQDSAKAFIEALVYRVASQKMSEAPSTLQPVLRTMQRLFGLQLLLKDLTPLVETGYFTPVQTRGLRRLFVDTCAELKNDAVSLVDVYAPPDFVQQSLLGKSDGLYEDHLWNAVKDKTDRPTYWKELIGGKLDSNKGNLIDQYRSKL